MMHRLKLHKVLIQSLTFSHNEQYLASLGGPDDKNTMIVWDVVLGKALYQAPLVGNEVHQVSFFNKSDDKLLAVVDQGIQILTVDKLNKKVFYKKLIDWPRLFVQIKSLGVNLGNMKRHFTCGIVDSADCFAYCGTKTGDVFEVPFLIWTPNKLTNF